MITVFTALFWAIFLICKEYCDFLVFIEIKVTYVSLILTEDTKEYSHRIFFVESSGVVNFFLKSSVFHLRSKYKFFYGYYFSYLFGILWAC